jgi:alkylated DNA repair dioxygenase AlkB
MRRQAHRTPKRRQAAALENEPMRVEETLSTAAVFERDRYVVLPSLLKQPTLGQFYRYACKSVESQRMISGDGQVDGTPRAYGDFIMDGLLSDLQPEIERATGFALFPTYSYLRVYKHGDTLARHTDRPACEISVSLCLGFDVEKSWPIWIEGPKGTSSIDLDAGDALLYRGIESPHWREAFDGNRQAQVFLHYVDQKGPHAEWKLDKRASTKLMMPVGAHRNDLGASDQNPDS